MSNLYSDKSPEPQWLNRPNHITNNFAEGIARAELGRAWVPPSHRNFRDVAPAESLAARKAARFSDCDNEFAAVFSRACREMEAA